MDFSSWKFDYKFQIVIIHKYIYHCNFDKITLYYKILIIDTIRWRVLKVFWRLFMAIVALSTWASAKVLSVYILGGDDTY